VRHKRNAVRHEKNASRHKRNAPRHIEKEVTVHLERCIHAEFQPNNEMYQVYERYYEINYFCLVKVLTYKMLFLKTGSIIEAFKIRSVRLMRSPVESVVT